MTKIRVEKGSSGLDQGPSESGNDTGLPVNPDFAICKFCGAPAGRPRYRLRECTLWVCEDCQGHYIDYLDPVEPAATPQKELSSREREYFRSTQHHNLDRNAAHVDMVASFGELTGVRVLDVGCGGGLFLSRVKELGGDVCGLDPSPVAVQFAREESGIDAHCVPVEDPDWQTQNRESFDIVTSWDVIEHVNFPREMLFAAAKMLRPGGYLFVGTPCRDTFYHRAGVATYKLSNGRYPTFLNQMYANTRFAHKQILSTSDISRLFDAANIELLRIDLLHELSLPYKHYLAKLVRSEALASIAAPLASIFFSVMHIKNKMIAIGRKR